MFHSVLRDSMLVGLAIQCPSSLESDTKKRIPRALLRKCNTDRRHLGKMTTQLATLCYQLTLPDGTPTNCS